MKVVCKIIATTQIQTNHSTASNEAGHDTALIAGHVTLLNDVVCSMSGPMRALNATAAKEEKHNVNTFVFIALVYK